jgi:hypothetical protein
MREPKSNEGRLRTFQKRREKQHYKKITVMRGLMGCIGQDPNHHKEKSQGTVTKLLDLKKRH